MARLLITATYGYDNSTRAATAPPRHFVGFTTLKGFAGLHRAYEVDGSAS